MGALLEKNSQAEHKENDRLILLQLALLYISLTLGLKNGIWFVWSCHFSDGFRPSRGAEYFCPLILRNSVLLQGPIVILQKSRLQKLSIRVFFIYFQYINVERTLHVLQYYATTISFNHSFLIPWFHGFVTSMESRRSF